MKWSWRRRENLVDGEWRWSFARRQLIYDVVEPERVYLKRWRFDTPFVSIFLHSINLPDRDPYPHTHPFSWSRSLIVKGSYIEERGPSGDDVRRYRPGQVNRIDADTIHRIVSTLGDRPVWTIFAAGKPHGRGWGFVIDGNYQDHKEYLEERASQRAEDSVLCPRCETQSLQVPNTLNALSRTTREVTDTPVYVCSDCGEAEAWGQHGAGVTPQDQWPVTDLNGATT